MEVKLSFFLFLTCMCLSSCNEWMVYPNDHTALLTGSCNNCHNLSYYLNDPSLYFTSHTVLTFIEGTHSLNQPIVVSGVTNLTLRGEIHNANATIKCGDNGGIFFADWTGINIRMMTFETCGTQLEDTLQTTLLSNYTTSSLHYHWNYTVGNNAYHTLMFINGSSLSLQSIIVLNGRGYGLIIVNSYDINITGSNFHGSNNIDNQCVYLRPSQKQHGGNIRIIHIPVVSPTHDCPYISQGEESMITIRDTVVSHGIAGNYFPKGRPSIPQLPAYVIPLFPLGGGIALLPIDYSCNRYKYLLHNVTTYENCAQYSGGNFAMYGLPVPITISNMRSYNGTASPKVTSSGVGLMFTVTHSLPTNNIQSQLTIVNSSSYNNRGTVGTGLYIHTYGERSWDSIVVQSCNFTSNMGYDGAGVFIKKSDIVDSGSLHVSLINVSISGSIKGGAVQSFVSAVSLTNINCNIIGLTISYSHQLRGLVLISSRVYVKNNNNIIRNNTAIAASGGGVLMDNDAFLIFQPNSSLSFINNYADVYGGGIYILPRRNATFSRPPCFFQINDTLSVQFNTSSGVRLIAINNTANVAGNFISGGELVNCYFTTENYRYSYCANQENPRGFCSNTLITDHIYPQPSSNNNFFISSQPVVVSVCINNTDISSSDRQFRLVAIPGKTFTVKLVLLGETLGIAPGSITGRVYPGTFWPFLSHFPSQSSIGTLTKHFGPTCTSKEFVAYQYGYDGTASTIAMSTPLTVSYLPASQLLQLIVHFDSCPPWFTLSPVDIVENKPLLSCDCNWFIKQANPNAVCNINTSIVTTSPLTGWIGWNDNDNCTFIGTTCPFDYCVKKNVSITINDTNAQCALDRSGILCGGCAGGLSLMLGSNKCGDCTNSSIALLLVFAVAGFALVILLIGLNLTVTVGTINGLIFYANIVKINESIFFPNGPIPFLSQFISWINLDLGIETCFYEGMKPSDKVWLQFIFPVYIWIIIGVIIIVVQKMTNRRIFDSITKHFKHLNLINVFATLLLLSFTKLFRVLVIIWRQTDIKCDNTTETRWHYDGTVLYGHDQHFPLLIFGSGFMVLFILPYCLFLIGIPVLERLPTEKYQLCNRIWLIFKPLVDAYAAPFKDYCRFWIGFLVFIRMIIVGLISSVTDQVTYLYILFFIILPLLMLYVILPGGPYNNRYLSILEQWFLIILLGQINICALQQDKQTGLIVSYSVALFTFICIIGWHLYLQLGNVTKNIQDRRNKNKELLRSSVEYSESTTSEEQDMDEGPKGFFVLVDANSDRSSQITDVASISSAGSGVSRTIVGIQRLQYRPVNSNFRDSALLIADTDENRK